MTDYATTDDVVTAWRALSAAETVVAASKLGFASRIVRSEIPDVDTRIAAGTLDPLLVRDVVVEMVLRHLRNPEGWRQESIEDFARTRDSTLSDGSVYLTAAELALLSKRGKRVFSVALGRETPSYATLEAAAVNRAGWGYAR